MLLMGCGGLFQNYLFFINLMGKYAGYIMMVLVVLLTGCQTTLQLNFKRGMVENAAQEKLVYYIGRKPQSPVQNKLFVMIQGSGGESITRRFGWGAEASLLGFDIIYLEKYAFDQPKLFVQTDCRERRIADINVALRHILDSEYNHAVTSILLFADSEGGDLVSEIANNFSEVKGIIIAAAGGMPQAKAFEVFQQRGTGFLQQAGIHTPEQLQRMYADIKKYPDTEHVWLGHTYYRWNSYLWNEDNIIQTLSIPMLYFQGTLDSNSPIESGYYLRDKMTQHANFEFHALEGLDHSFSDQSGKNHFSKIVREIILPWYQINFGNKAQP